MTIYMRIYKESSCLENLLLRVRKNEIYGLRSTFRSLNS